MACTPLFTPLQLRHRQPSPPHFSAATFHLRLPLRNSKHKNLSLLHNFPRHPPSQPLTPPTNKKEKKNKTRKCASTSHILPLMDALHFPIPVDIYTSLVKECTLSGNPETAIELHTHITRSGIQPPLPLINRILIMFVSCGLFDNARHVFDSMLVRDFHSWAILFVAYYENSYYENATDIFLGMLCQLGVLEFPFPPWIWSCLLTACACTVNVPLGMQVHGCLLKLGACDIVLISSSLIRFYGRFKCSEEANVVFNKVSRHNTLTWTAKIVSGCKERHFSEALGDFKEMGRLGIKKDTFTFSSVLKACGRMQNHGSCGEQVHADTIKLGLDSDNYVLCSLVAMYGRSGLLRDAKQVFERTRNERNVDSWNAMLMGYIQNGLYIEAVKFVYQMKAAGVHPHESLLDKLRIACELLLESKWTFITKEEHPYLNRPWYKLHPCGTSEWVKLLLCGDTSLNKDFIEQYLVSWFSVVGQGYQETVANSWNQPCQGTYMIILWKKLHRLQPLIRELSRNINVVHLQLAEARTELDMAQREVSLDRFNPEYIVKVKNCTDKVLFLSNLEEYTLKQRTKLKWLQVGDGNNAYFHATLKDKQRQNVIQALQTEDGRIVSTPVEIENEIIGFYEGLMGSSAQGLKGVNLVALRDGSHLTRE